MLPGKKTGGIVATVVVLGLLYALPLSAQIPDEGQVVDTEPNEVLVTNDPLADNQVDHEDPEDYLWDSSDVIEILLNETAITTSGVGAEVEANTVTITRGGTYSISGVLLDGQIIVDSADKETVRLILAGVDIRCSSSAPVLVKDAEKTLLVLAEDTMNYMADGRASAAASLQADEPNAVIFSRDDLTICGSGWLTICGDVNDGISSRDGLIIAGGIIDINAVDDGIWGKDYVAVRGGDILVDAGGDGLKSDNDKDDTKGYVSIESGVINITSGANAIEAQTDVLIADGDITLRSGGGTRRRANIETSGKGIAAGVSVTVDGGNLDINANDDAIHSNGTMAINGGMFVLSSSDDALHSDSSVEVNGGDIQIAWCYEAVDSNTVTINDGYLQIVSVDDGIIAGESVSILGGVIDTIAGGDAIAGNTEVKITGGEIVLTTGDGSNARVDADESAKGIKGIDSVVIDGGTIIVDSADDAIHSNGTVTINGGTLLLSSGDDGIRADGDLAIHAGDIEIAKSYEGLESANADITINGGNIRIVSTDDGINVANGGMDFGMGGPGGWPGGGGADLDTSGSCCLYINGGYLFIDAMGDGLDSNGSVVMTDGLVIVNGPTANMNGALDHASFQLTGGFLLAVGSSGMAQAPSTSSTQCSILLTFRTTLAAHTLVHIQNSEGEDILSFVPTKQYSSVAFSSQALVEGSAYDVYYGGSSTGTAFDGLYQDGTYAPGTKYASFTISSMVTNVGDSVSTGGQPGGAGAVREPITRR
jgi:adhesin HecA-like repeat protein